MMPWSLSKIMSQSLTDSEDSDHEDETTQTAEEDIVSDSLTYWSSVRGVQSDSSDKGVG